MVPVDHVTQESQGAHGVNQHAVAQHGPAHVGDQNVGNDPHSGHDRDVDLRMSEEPEQVLPQKGGTARVRLQRIADDKITGNKEAGPGHMIQE